MSLQDVELPPDVCKLRDLHRGREAAVDDVVIAVAAAAVIVGFLRDVEARLGVAVEPVRRSRPMGWSWAYAMYRS